jgi:hypothetical protein
MTSKSADLNEAGVNCEKRKGVRNLLTFSDRKARLVNQVDSVVNPVLKHIYFC